MAITRSYAKLPAQNSGRARQFWSEHFGLEPHRELHGHLTYDAFGTELVVFPSSGSPSGNHDQFGLVTDDIETEVERLRAAGVRFEEFPPPPGGEVRDGIVRGPGLKAAWFKDSEGNLISLAQFGD
jgi:catechol 2,3-dioxygenase-like lactoylglutathione lyase family enzyme